MGGQLVIATEETNHRPFADPYMSQSVLLCRVTLFVLAIRILLLKASSLWVANQYFSFADQLTTTNFFGLCTYHPTFGAPHQCMPMNCADRTTIYDAVGPKS